MHRGARVTAPARARTRCSRTWRRAPAAAMDGAATGGCLAAADLYKKTAVGVRQGARLRPGRLQGAAAARADAARCWQRPHAPLDPLQLLLPPRAPAHTRSRACGSISSLAAAVAHPGAHILTPEQDYVIKRHVRLFPDHFTTYRDARCDAHDSRDYDISPESVVS